MIQRKIVNVSWHTTQSNVIDTDCALRQRLDELATIRFRLDASIENDNKTCVGFFCGSADRIAGQSNRRDQECRVGKA